MNMLKTEWAKLKEMNFTDKRQYIWEYYKLHIFGFLALSFFIGSLLNTMIFNPPRQDYLYFAWLGQHVTSITLEEFTESLDIIVENPDRYVVRATNYNTEGLDPQMVMGLQTRFVAQLQLGILDLFMISREELYGFSSSGLVLPIKSLLSELEDINSTVRDIMNERLVELTFYLEDYELITDYMAVSMYDVPFFDKFGIPTDDLYLAVVINSERLGRVIRALEVIFDV